MVRHQCLWRRTPCLPHALSVTVLDHSHDPASPCWAFWLLPGSVIAWPVRTQAMASSLRLADEPAPADRAAADGVFSRLMALHKGRALLARTLHLLDAPLCALEGPGPHLDLGTSPSPNPNSAGPPEAAARPPATAARAQPLRPLWAVLRNARALFGVGVRAGAKVGAGPGGSVGGPEAMADATVTELGATARLAAAAAKARALL